MTTAPGCRPAASVSAPSPTAWSAPGELAGWADRQLNRLIFLPGFTTAASVTAVSGRGVGMDVVQTNIERLGGTVDLQSTPGAGTVFTVRIPLTLAIISALVVDAGGQRFALPQTCVAELVRVERRGTEPSGHLAIEHVDDTPMLRLRDKLLPLVSLAKLLKLTPKPDDAAPLTVVVAQLGGLLAGSAGGRSVRHGGDRRQTRLAPAPPHPRIQRQHDPW